MANVSIDHDLLARLVCPVSKQPMVFFPATETEPEFLFSPKARLRYRIDAGLPVLLAEEATTVSPEETETLIARGRQTGIQTGAVGKVT